jgi:RNA polymerase sigma factor (sigma-70 family)
MLGAVELTDDQVRRAAEGSQDDLGHLLSTLEPQVRLMAVARLSPTPAQVQVVDDITQQVMIALTTGLCRLKHATVAGIKPFLSGIVAHKVADFLRGHGEGKIVMGGGSLDSTVGAFSNAGPLWQFLSVSGTSPHSAAERAELAARLIAELGRLKPQHREVITLAFFDQLPVSEIAIQMDISRPAVSMLLIRAVQTLRRNMTGSSKVEKIHGREG